MVTTNADEHLKLLRDDDGNPELVGWKKDAAIRMVKRNVDPAETEEILAMLGLQ